MSVEPSGQGAVPALQLEGVGRRFGGLVAVSDVALTVQPGERRAILGPNGAGKTTLFNLIAGDYKPTSGTVTLFGDDVTRLPPRKRVRRGLTRTYQSALLFGGLTVIDNLYLAVRGATPHRLSVLRPGRNDARMERARSLAAQVGLGSYVSARVAELSHGEQRQVEIGMALAGNPKLLILDEPAAGLSPAERGDLTNMLLELPATITLLLVEHDMDVAFRVARTVTVMHDGRIVADGTPDEIQHNQMVHDIYLGDHDA